MPEARERKYPDAGRELGWFWVFPSRTLYRHPTGSTAPGRGNDPLPLPEPSR